MIKLNYLPKALPIFIFILFFPTSIYAQNLFGNHLSGGVDVGFARFTNNDNGLGTGFSIRAYGEYTFAPHLSLTLFGGYIEFDENITLGSGTFSTTEPTRFDEAYVTGGIRARLVPIGGFVPYIMGGAGVYNGHKEIVTLITPGIADTTRTIQSNDFGFNVGGGFEYFLNKNVSLTLEVLLHSIQGDIDEEILDITGGLRYIPISVK
jgi:opacity protein-like surface antigen